MMFLSHVSMSSLFFSIVSHLKRFCDYLQSSRRLSVLEEDPLRLACLYLRGVSSLARFSVLRDLLVVTTPLGLLTVRVKSSSSVWRWQRCKFSSLFFFDLCTYLDTLSVYSVNQRLSEPIALATQIVNSLNAKVMTSPLTPVGSEDYRGGGHFKKPPL